MGATGGSSTTGVCTASTDCAGPCQMCNSSQLCVSASGIDDPSGHCSGTCDATGACKSKKGQVCTATTGGCVSGSTCTKDGYCCTQSCGSDATCAGSCAGRSDGSCQYPTAACGAASCSGTGIVDRGSCSGGMCVTPALRACDGNFSCSGNACKTSCMTEIDCVSSSYYCASGGCLAKKTPGQTCSAASECTTTSCGGRCCSTSAACTCPAQSTANLIANSGFDSNLTGWALDSASGPVKWVADDSDGCSLSGSVELSGFSNSPSKLLSQCVVVTPVTSYKFGTRMAITRGTAQTTDVPPHCDLDLYTDATCTVGMTNASDVQWINVGWSDIDVDIQTGSNTKSARLSCRVENDTTIHVDKLYLTPAPEGF